MSLVDEGRTKGLRAVAHPVRLRILSLLTGAEMSAAEIARELDITQATAALFGMRDRPGPAEGTVQ